MTILAAELDLLSLAGFTGINVVLVAVAAWLVKIVLEHRLKESIAHEYTKKIEEFRHDLKTQHEVALARVRSDLEVDKARRGKTFEVLHLKMVDTIEMVYAALMDLHVAVSSYVQAWEVANPGEDPSQVKPKKREAVREKLVKFEEVFRPRRIYLPKRLAEDIAKLQQQLFANTHKFMLHVEQSRGHRSVDKWEEIENAVSVELQQLAKRLEDEMRKLIGHEQGPEVVTTDGQSKSV